MGLLSGGQRQSIYIVNGYYDSSRTLLLDEHTEAPDPKTAENVLQLTDKLVAEHNPTTPMITHNMRMHCDLVILPHHDGRWSNHL